MRTSQHACDSCKKTFAPGETFISINLDKQIEVQDERVRRRSRYAKPGEKITDTFAFLDLCTGCAEKPLDLTKIVEWETDEYTDD
jgi:hypothetical protein